MSAKVDLRAIEREIEQIREREANPYSAGTRTNLFTLLIFRAEGASQQPKDRAGAALAHLLGRRPARIITFERSQSLESELSVSGRCSPDRLNRGVCFEEVYIQCGDDGVGSDPGTWAPLLIRDLPTFAWWPDGLATGILPVEDPIAGVSDRVDKVIIDSAAAQRTGADAGEASPAQAPFDAAGMAVGSPAPFDIPTDTRSFPAELGLLLKTRDTKGGSYLVTDFAWRRGQALREQSARAFDPPEHRELISRIRGVRLRGGMRAEAQLYFHWLAQRLRWTRGGSRDGLPVVWDQARRDIRLSHDFEGPLAEGFVVTFSFEGAPDLPVGCTRGGCVSIDDEKSAYRFPTDGEILLQEVYSLVRDSSFHEVLAHAVPGQS